MPATYVLHQHGNNPFNTHFEDIEGRPAFSIKEVDLQNPNLIVKVAREPSWTQQHRDIMGPNNGFLYFGPSLSPGYLVYGNDRTQPMLHSIKQKKDSSNSRYFHAQNGKEFKWRLGVQRMECLCGNTVIAVWEVATSGEATAKLTIKHTGLATITEILTSFTLNCIAQALNWPVALRRTGNTSP